MTTWWHHPTIFNLRLDKRLATRVSCILLLCIALITTLFFNVVAQAAPGVNQTIGFQGRLLDANGDIVADGYYNMQFKIYENGSGEEAGNPDGTLKWTETYVNNNSPTGAVEVKNGFMSVNLGSENPFGDSIDWDQDTLWLSMNIAGSSTACTTFGSGSCAADGEMLPMKRLTATPYALNAGAVNGKTAADLIQNGTEEQNANFNINGTGEANILQGNSSVLSPYLDTIDNGPLSIGTANASSISIGSLDGDQTISIGSGSGNNDVTIGSLDGSSSTVIQGGVGGVAVKIADGSSFSLTNQDDESIASISNSGALFTVPVFATGSIGASNAANTESTSIGIDGLGKGYLGTTSNSLLLQGGGANLLTAINNNGQANIGIGNSASSGYALDVTGAINTSDAYYLNGVSVLSNSGLTFNDDSTSTITAASGQSLQLSSDIAVHIGDGSDLGEPTLLTVDKSASTPLAAGEQFLGSMYYDTTLGVVQCYEADGWGACSARPDSFTSLSPEYSNAVMNGSNLGTMNSDLCSDTLNINDGSTDQPTICGENETFNFYNWTSDQLTSQTKSIYVTHKLPGTFKEFIAGSTSLMGRTDSIDSTVTYQVFRNDGSGLTACGSVVAVSTGVQTTWQKAVATSGADPSACEFAAGDSIVFKINLSANDDANAYVSNLDFAYSNN